MFPHHNCCFWRNCVPEQSQPPRLGGTVMASQNSVLGQQSLFRATALVRPGVVIVARTCESKFVSMSSLLFAGKQISSLGKRAVERSLWLCVFLTDKSRMLFPCRKVVDPCDLAQGKESRGRRRQEKQHGRKKRSENGALTRARAASYFVEHSTEG